MSDPINYNAAFANTPNPFDSFAKGMALGNAVQAPFIAQQQAEAESRQAQALEAARQRVLSGDASAEDRVNYLTMVDPAKAKAAQEAFGQMDKALALDAAKSALQISTAIETGGIDVAKQLLETRAQGYINQGTPEGKQQADYINNVLVKGLDANPKFVQDHLLNLVSLSPDGPDLIDAYNSTKKLPSEINLTDAQAAKAWADALKMQEGPELSADSEKVINMAVDAVSGGLLLAQQAENLADAIDKAKPAGGWIGQGAEAWKRAIGGQDTLTSLRQEYVKLRNSDVLKNLPPGVASDKDIEIALKAFPDESANPAQISQFLRGMGKLQRYSSSINKAKAEWISQNGNLGPARRPLTISDQNIDKGTSFWGYTKNIPIPNVAPGASKANDSLTLTLSNGAVIGPFPDKATLEAARADAIKQGLIKS